MQKQIFKLGLIALFVTGSLTLAGCGSNNDKQSGDAQEEQHQHEKHDHGEEGVEENQEAAYICPMECEGSASDEPGQCPECGMDLEKNTQE